jgi:hypothetical protein
VEIEESAEIGGLVGDQERMDEEKSEKRWE